MPPKYLVLSSQIWIFSGSLKNFLNWICLFCQTISPKIKFINLNFGKLWRTFFLINNQKNTCLWSDIMAFCVRKQIHILNLNLWFSFKALWITAVRAAALKVSQCSCLSCRSNREEIQTEVIDKALYHSGQHWAVQMSWRLKCLHHVTVLDFTAFISLTESCWQKTTFIRRQRHDSLFSDIWLRKLNVLLTLFAVASLFVVGGGDAPLDFEVWGRLAVELAVGSRFGQREVAAGGRLAGLQLGGNTHNMFMSVICGLWSVVGCN